jgi:large subunit ribosomal protein L35
MPTLKTIKGLKRRFKITATGKLTSHRSGRRHLLGAKRAKIKRHLRRPKAVSRADGRNIRALFPYQ